MKKIFSAIALGVFLLTMNLNSVSASTIITKAQPLSGITTYQSDLYNVKFNYDQTSLGNIHYLYQPNVFNREVLYFDNGLSVIYPRVEDPTYLTGEIIEKYFTPDGKEATVKYLDYGNLFGINAVIKDTPTSVPFTAIGMSIPQPKDQLPQFLNYFQEIITSLNVNLSANYSFFQSPNYNLNFYYFTNFGTFKIPEKGSTPEILKTSNVKISYFVSEQALPSNYTFFDSYSFYYINKGESGTLVRYTLPNDPNIYLSIFVRSLQVVNTSSGANPKGIQITAFADSEVNSRKQIWNIAQILNTINF